MKHKVFLALALLVAMAVQAQTYWDGTSNKVFSGSGTQADPYLISTPEQLAGLAERTNVDKEDFAGKWFKLTQDLWFTDFDHTEKNTWKEWVPIGKMTITQNPHDQYQMTFDTCRFNGNFDGDGHTIHNVYMGSVGEVMLEDPDDPTATAILDFTGTDNSFFGYVKDAVIKNLTIDNLGLAATGNMGGLAAVVHNSTVSNVHITNSYVNQSNTMPYLVGGLIGTASASVIEDCSTDNVSVQACFSGGLIGTLKGQSVLRRSHAIGNVYVMSRNVDSNAQGNGGGLVRTVGEDCIVEDCYASVNLQGGTPANSLAAGRLGGFCAFNEGTIRNSYATGNIKRGTAGGFCSRNTGIIESCYCTGDMQSGENAGAFVQENGYEYFVLYVGTVDVYPGTIRNCFSTGRSYAVSDNDTTNYTFNFLTSYLSSGYDYGKDGSMNAGCFFNADSVKALPEGSSKNSGGTRACTKAEMQSQAFVDTLNMIAAIFGLNKWQYNAGAYPTLTGEKATDISAVFAGGDGTKEHPFLIDNLQHLKNFRNMVHNGLDFRGMYIKQTADIALNLPQDQWAQQMPEQWIPIGDAVPVPVFNNTFQYRFRGDYDGGFHEVQNMYIHNLNTIQGFFGQLAVDAVVHNLGVTGAYVKCSGSGGIVAGGFPRYDPRITVAQCWTSGSIDGYNVGAVIGPVPLEGTVCLLNCSSSATAHGSSASWAAGPDFYSVGAGSKNDTIGNFLFTGQLNHDDPTIYGSSCTPNGGFSTNFNGYYDIEKAGGTYTESVYADLGRSTAELQTREQANIFNAYVDKWNATHDFQLNYWEWQEGEYPRINPNFQPPHKVTYDSKGGSAVASERVIDNSFILPPDKPTKEGFIFAGWYSDEAGTQFFDYDLTPITGNLTLYAKWLTPTYGDYDLTPFVNQFATEYHIANKAQLIGFAKTVNGIDGVQEAFNFDGKVIYLDADILLNDTTDWRHWGRYCYAESWEPIGIDGHAFRGRFEGQGHIISGLFYNGDVKYYTYQGLFGSVGASSVTDVAIRQVGVQASAVLSYGNGGLLVGCFRDKGLLEQCFATGNAFNLKEGNSATWHGGLAGILGGEYIGEGGSTVKDCFARVNMYTNRVNHNERTPLLVSGCAFTAYTSSVSTSNCYAAGLATNAGLGSSSSKPADSFWDKDLITDSSYGTAKTSNQLHAKATFANWDFENVWGRSESINDGYPYLRCFYEPVADDADAIVVTGISLEETEATLIAGDSIQLHAAVIPAEAVNQKIIWTSSGDAGAKVDENGKVRTYFVESKAGYNSSIQITAKSYEGDFSKTFNLTVVHPSATIAIRHSRRIGDTEWGKTQGTAVNNFYFVNGWEYMVAAYTKPDSIYKPFQWTSSDETLLAIEPLVEDSLIQFTNAEYHCSVVILKCLGEGEVTFAASDKRGWKASDTQTIKNYVLKEVSVSPETPVVPIGNTLQMEAILTPSYTTQAHHITWSSSDESVLTVDENGLVTTKTMGSATVTASVDGTEFAAQTEVTVSDVTIIAPSTSIHIGDIVELSTDSEVEGEWSTSDESILTVDENGQIIGIDEGTADITYSIPSLNYSTSLTFTVEHVLPTKISMRVSSVTLAVGESTQLEVVFTPENTTFREIEWSSSGSSYVSVDENGLITCLKKNRKYITITAQTPNGLKATCKVYTADPVAATAISLDKTAATMVRGETLQLEATLTPADANTQITWTSTNENVAVVDNYGLITAISAGTAVIKATAGSVSASCTITVQSVRYTIRFLNWDGEVLQSSQVEEDNIPVYEGATPTRPKDENYIYAFSGWSPEIVPAEGDADYTAQYTAIERPNTPEPVYYTIRFLNWDGEVLQSSQVEEGDIPVYEGTTPVRAEDENYTYEFSGWSPAIVVATADADYTAQYTATEKPIIPEPVYYTIRFLNWDGEVLQSSQVGEGDMPVYEGTTPVRAEDENYTYEFSGWSPAIVVATADADYTAQYTATEKPIIPEPVYYTIRFLNWDGEVLQSSQVEEGNMPLYEGTTPVRAEDENYTYEFSGWSPAIVVAAVDADYTAQYTATEKPIGEAITVRLYPSTAPWQVVYLYAWLAGTEEQVLGRWPGTQVAKDSEGWWAYTFDKHIRAINIIWTNGEGDQTVDIVNVTESTCYGLDGTDGTKRTVAVVDCDQSIQAIEDIQVEATDAPRKIIMDNVIYILRRGKIHTITGVEVK